MHFVYAIVLTLLNLLFWFGIVFNLPGTWLMVLAAAIVEWLNPGEFMFGWTVLYAAAALALLGELLEFAWGAAGARRAGGSGRGAAMSIVGGIVGAILGLMLPIPVVGSLIGACLGAFAGALLGDLSTGRALHQSVGSGRGAAIGRFWGTVGKLAIGAVIFVVLSVAAFV